MHFKIYAKRHYPLDTLQNFNTRQCHWENECQLLRGGGLAHWLYSRKGIRCTKGEQKRDETDLATRHAVILTAVEVVRIFAERENGMAGRKEEVPIALAAFAEIETTSAFEVRVGLGSNLETESGSEWATYVGYRVNGGEVVEEPRSGGPGEDGLVVCDFDVGDLGIGKNLLAAHGRDLGIVAGECLGHHAHPKEEGIGFLSDFGKADGVDAHPLEVNGIEVLVDLFT